MIIICKSSIEVPKTNGCPTFDSHRIRIYIWSDFSAQLEIQRGGTEITRSFADFAALDSFLRSEVFAGASSLSEYVTAGRALSDIRNGLMFHEMEVAQ